MEKKITVGEFTFYIDERGKLWLERADNVMQLCEETKEALERVLVDFWEENF